MTTDIQKRHTPAPWKIVPEYNMHIMTEDGYAICDMAVDYSSLKYEENFANARLIVAAPKMFDALLAIRQFISNLPDNVADKDLALKNINNAIAESKG